MSFNFELILTAKEDHKSFENLKNEFTKELTKFKLENYLRKVKMKNLGILDEANKENFYFIDPTEKQLKILNNLKKEDIYSEEFDDEIEMGKNENLENKENLETYDNNSQLDRDLFKARIFGYLHKNFQNVENFENSEKTEKNSLPKNLDEKSKNLYRVFGVNVDEEKIKNWKSFLVLMNSSNLTSENKNQKLIKVCFPENQFKLNFALILNFDKPCTNLINKITSHKILSEDPNSDKISKNLHSIQGEILTNKVSHKLENLNDYSKSKSFLEKSSQSEEKEEKNYSIDYLAQKFSVDELNKIKFLIKFAKKNEIIDIISKSKGDMSLMDLITQQKIKNKKFVRPFSNFNLNMKDLSDKNVNSTTMIKMMANEIYDLKTIVMNQNSEMEILFDDMKKNMNEMKSLIGKSGGNKKNVQNEEKVNEKKEEDKVKKDDNLEDMNKIKDLFGYHDGTEANSKENDKVNNKISKSSENNVNKVNNNNLRNGNSMQMNGSIIPMNVGNMPGNNMVNNMPMNMNNMNMANVPMNIPINNMQMNMNGVIPMNNMQMNMNGNMQMNGMAMNNLQMNNMQMNNVGMNNSQNIHYVNNNNNIGINNPNNLQNNFKFKETNSGLNSHSNTNNLSHSLTNTENNKIKRDRPPHNLTLMRRNGKPLSPFLTASNLSSFQDDDDVIEKNIKHNTISNKNYVDP